jgi:membrane fusion protein (multidrug efflux system)
MNDTTTLDTKAKKPRTWLRMTVMLLVVGLLGGGLVFFQTFKAGILKQVTAQIRSSVPTVATAPASLQDWQPRLTAVGTARAVNGADMSADINGTVEQINFESGQTVKAGTVLLRLRHNDDEAKLAQLQASAALAEVTLQRDLRQLAAKGVAQSVVDTDTANLKVANAQVAAQQALMAQKTVRAPFDGRLGTRLVDLGQYLPAGTAIVSLQQLDPMLVDFNLPQQALGQIATGQKVEVTADAWPSRVFAGTVTAINSKVDAASRMLQVRATVPNPDGALLPGMYLNVAAASGPAEPRVTVPLAAVAFNPYGALVYVVQPDGKTVRQQFVTTGAQRGDQVAILKGVAATDVIVTAGQMKLHNGSAIKIDNSLQPSNDPAPQPADK